MFKSISSLLLILNIIAFAIVCVGIYIHIEILAFIFIILVLLFSASMIVISEISRINKSELKEEYEELLIKETFINNHMKKVMFLKGPVDQDGVNLIIIFHGKVETSYLSFEEMNMLFEVPKE